MLSILLLFTITVVSAAPREKEIIVAPQKFLDSVQNIVDKCMSESNAEPNAFKNMLQGDAENEASLNFAYCYLQNAGFLENDGKIKVDKVTSFVKKDDVKEEARKSFEECNKSSGKDPKDTVRILLACYKENSPIMFKLP